jgi:hypothetical protein
VGVQVLAGAGGAQQALPVRTGPKQQLLRCDARQALLQHVGLAGREAGQRPAIDIGPRLVAEGGAGGQAEVDLRAAAVSSVGGAAKGRGARQVGVEVLASICRCCCVQRRVQGEAPR